MNCSPHSLKLERLARAILAVQQAVFFLSNLGTVAHQEARAARELVRLSRENRHVELFLGQVSTRKLKAFRRFGLVLVNYRRLAVITAPLEFLNGIFAVAFFVLARCIVISGHFSP